MEEGRIIKGIGGFYYVMSGDNLIECRARGIFREQGITPMVGDKVNFRFDENTGTGYIEEIHERKSELLRPMVSNVTQAIIVVSTKDPEPNLWLVDKMLTMAEEQKLNIVMCINKSDLDEQKAKEFASLYDIAGYHTILTSNKTGLGIDALRDLLNNNISVFAGASGSGKSSLLNSINPSFKLLTDQVSRKTSRGRHTTRHAELYALSDESFVLDTPGFSSLAIDFVQEPEDLRFYYREIELYSGKCKFQSCLHDSEPGCEVKKAVEAGNIGESRYKNYIILLDELRKRRKF